MKDMFVTGATVRKIPEKTAVHIFDLMAYFAGYGFNKSHSAAYALISYQTAYLKAHYPVEFWAALLTNALDDTEKIGTFLAGAKELGIRVLSPDVNDSLFDFAVHPDRTIRFGLGAVKNVGKQAVDAILLSRESEGPFLSYPDFLKRIEGKKVNRRVIESLIKAGTFDSFGIRRSEAFDNLEPLLEWVGGKKKKKKTTMAKLFREFDQVEEDAIPWIVREEWDEKTLLKEERDALGFYLSRHPLTPYSDWIAQLDGPTLSDLDEMAENTTVSIFGIVSAVKEIKTKKGDRMAQIQLMDFGKSVEVVLFPDIFGKSEAHLAIQSPIHVTGVLERNDFGTKIRALRVNSLEQLRESFTKMVVIRLCSDGLNETDLLELKAMLREFPGPVPTLLELEEMTFPRTIHLIPTRINVSPKDILLERLKGRFGPDSVAMKKEIDPRLTEYLVREKRKGGARP